MAKCYSAFDVDPKTLVFENKQRAAKKVTLNSAG